MYWGGTEIQRCEWYFLLERLYWDGQLATEDAKGRLKMRIGLAVWPGAVLQGGLGRVGDGHQDFTGGAFHDDSVLGMVIRISAGVRSTMIPLVVVV